MLEVQKQSKLLEKQLRANNRVIFEAEKKRHSGDIKTVQKMQNEK
jgi:hypothetical protein